MPSIAKCETDERVVEYQAWPRVAVIVLNWNSASDTITCLDSLVHLDCPSPSIIVVDNGSFDDSVEQIRSAYPDVTLIENGSNLGYVGGNNAGIRHALALGSEYIWLLNDDVTVAADSLRILIEAALQEPSAAFLGPKVYVEERENRILSAGGIFNTVMQPALIGIGEEDIGQYDTSPTQNVDFLSGCALLVNARTLNEIGPLDEDYFAYFEDVEWCYRAKIAGWRVLFVPRSKVWHPNTNTRDVNSSLVTYYSTRNHLLFIRTHALGWWIFLATIARSAIWVGNWTINPKWKHYRRKRNALFWAIVDGIRGTTGKCRRKL